MKIVTINCCQKLQLKNVNVIRHHSPDIQKHIEGKLLGENRHRQSSTPKSTA